VKPELEADVDFDGNGSDEDEGEIEIVSVETGESQASVSLSFSPGEIGRVLSDSTDDNRCDEALAELPQLIDHCSDHLVYSILPVICENINSWIPERQWMVALLLDQLLNKILEGSAQSELWEVVTSGLTLLETSLSTVPQESLEPFHELWREVVGRALLLIDTDVSQLNYVLKKIEQYGASDSILERILGAMLLGSCARNAPSDFINQRLFPLLEVFAKDSAGEHVYATALSSIAVLSRNVKLLDTEKHLWKYLSAVISGGSDEFRLHSEALYVTAEIAWDKRLKGDAGSVFFKELLPPVLLKECAFATFIAADADALVMDDSYVLLETISETFGELLYSVSLHLESGYRRHAFKAFTAMCACTGSIVRRNCAFNLPGVAVVLEAKYANELCGIIETFSRDSDRDVRLLLARGFHELSKTLSKRGKLDKLFAPLIRLIKDSDAEVRMSILEHLNATFGPLAHQAGSVVMEHISPIFEWLRRKGQGAWRFQELLANQMKLCSDFFPASSIEQHFLTPLKHMILEGPAPVRRAAARATIQCLRCLPDKSVRESCIDKYYSSLIYSKSATRLYLVYAAEDAAEIFSSTLFALYFAPTVLRVVSDRSSCIRLRLAMFLPKCAVLCMASESVYPCVLDAHKRLLQDSDPDTQLVMNEFDVKRQEYLDSHDFQHDRSVLMAEEADFRMNFGSKKGPSKQSITRRIGKVSDSMSSLRSSTSKSMSTSSGSVLLSQHSLDEKKLSSKPFRNFLKKS